MRFGRRDGGSPRLAAVRHVEWADSRCPHFGCVGFERTGPRHRRRSRPDEDVLWTPTRPRAPASTDLVGICGKQCDLRSAVVPTPQLASHPNASPACPRALPALRLRPPPRPRARLPGVRVESQCPRHRGIRASRHPMTEDAWRLGNSLRALIAYQSSHACRNPFVTGPTSPWPMRTCSTCTTGSTPHEELVRKASSASRRSS